MNKNSEFMEVIRLFFDYGSYVLPLVRYILENSEVDESWKYFFKAVEEHKKLNYTKSLRFTSKGIGVIEKQRETDEKYKNTLIYYILLEERMTLLQQISQSENKQEIDEIYFRLKREFSKIPGRGREIIVSSLLSYAYDMGDTDIELFKATSEKYEQRKETLAFNLLAKARREALKGEYEEAEKLYNESYKAAIESKKPLLIATVLNSYAWNFRNINYEKSKEMIKKAFELKIIHEISYEQYYVIFDSLFEINKINNDMMIHDTAVFLCYFYRFLPSGKGKRTKQGYKKVIMEAEKYIPDFDKKEYEFDKKLYGFVKKHISSAKTIAALTGISVTAFENILKKNCMTIRGSTLNKIIKALNIIPSIDEPLPVMTEYLKINIDSDFERAKEIFSKLSERDLIIKFLSYYSVFPSVFRDKGFIKNIFSEDYLDFINKSYKNKKSFVEVFLEGHPFIEIRKKTTCEFMEKLSDDEINKFYKKYLSFSEDERLLIDEFIRAYKRYDGFELGFIPDLTDKQKNIINKYNLEAKTSVMAFYSFENEERIKIEKVFNNMI